MTPEETAKHVFARNPKLEKVFVTSDGQCFSNEDGAEGHATRLKDQKITVVTKSPNPEGEQGGDDAFAKAEITPKIKDLNVVGATTAAVGAPVKSPNPKGEQNPPAGDPEQDTFVGDDEVAGKILDGNISEVTERLESVELAEALDHLSTVETAGQDRKGVHEAIDARKKVIAQA